MDIKRFIRDIYLHIIQFAYLFPTFKRKKQFENSEYTNSNINGLQNAIKIHAEITPVFKNKEGILTIISDDGVYTTGKYLKKYSEKYQISITVAGSVKVIFRHKRFWRTSEKEHQFECVNHSYNHQRMSEDLPIAKNRKKLFHEIIHSKIFFEKLFKYDSFTFVCPENQMCDLGYEIISENDIYAVARGTRGFNSLTIDKGTAPGQWLNLKRMGIRDNTEEDIRIMRKQWVDIAIKQHKWLIEMWHDVNIDDKFGYQTILPEEAEEHLEYISKRKNELWTALFTDAVKYIYERQNATVKAFLDKDYLYISLQIDSLPIEIFNHELTVKVNCSPELFDNCNLDYFFENDCRYLLVDVLPGEVKRIPIQ